MAVIESAKLTVIGTGAVGTSLAYAVPIRESARKVALCDIDTARVEAEVLDLAHGTPFTGTSRIRGGSDCSPSRTASPTTSRTPPPPSSQARSSTARRR